jgi:hypothetical protein
VADLLQAFMVTTSQLMTMPQSIPESSGAYRDSPVSQGAGLRSISLLRGWRCGTTPQFARGIPPSTKALWSISASLMKTPDAIDLAT